MYICSDCGEEVDEQDASPHAKSFPEPLCQLCMRDLKDENYKGGRIEKFIPETEEEKLLNVIFGDSNDKRTFRKGSSQINIDFEKRRLNAKNSNQNNALERD